MPRKKRRSTRLAERLTPCRCCGYPLSQRHHLFQVHRYGENGFVAHLCANCHEAFHIFQAALLDLAVGRRKTRVVKEMGVIYRAWGGDGAPRLETLFLLLDGTDHRQRTILSLKGHLMAPPTEKEQAEIRRGDLVRLSDGQVVRVVSTAGGYIFTTAGTYGPWQVERISKGSE